jgi:hypothetical protein
MIANQSMAADTLKKCSKDGGFASIVLLLLLIVLGCFAGFHVADAPRRKAQAAYDAKWTAECEGDGGRVQYDTVEEKHPNYKNRTRLVHYKYCTRPIKAN